MTKIYFILIFLISFVTVYAQNESDSAQVTAQTEMPQSAAVQTFPTKTEADSAYIRNDFAASVEMYENILKNEGESSDIYYNLGNSYYKMNNIAKAVLNYERALLLNPGNSVPVRTGPWSGQMVLMSSATAFFSRACTCGPYLPTMFRE